MVRKPEHSECECGKKRCKPADHLILSALDQLHESIDCERQKRQEV